MFAASTCSSVACQAVLRENFVNRGRTAVIVPVLLLRAGHDDDPVADDRQVGVLAASWTRRPCDLAAKLAVLGEHVVGAAMLDRDPAGDGVAVREGLVQAAQPVVPAERFEFGQAETPFRPRVHESGARDCAPVGRGPVGSFESWVPVQPTDRATRVAEEAMALIELDLLRRGRTQYYGALMRRVPSGQGGDRYRENCLRRAPPRDEGAVERRVLAMVAAGIQSGREPHRLGREAADG